MDKCPTVYAKTADGCPPPLVLEGVNFDNDLASLRPEAIGLLERPAIGIAIENKPLDGKKVDHDIYMDVRTGLVVHDLNLI